MARIQFADFWPQLMGLVPAYSRDGVNGTSILLEKNPTIFSEFKTKTLLAQLTRTFLMEPRVVQAAFSNVCGRRYNVPIALRRGLVMIPVRARTARVKDDGTRAYLVKDKIREYLPEDKQSKQSGTRFVFANGTTLDVPHRFSSMRGLMMAAELVEQEAAKLIGYMIDRTGCEVREDPESFCCKKCPQKEECYREE